MQCVLSHRELHDKGGPSRFYSTEPVAFFRLMPEKPVAAVPRRSARQSFVALTDRARGVGSAPQAIAAPAAPATPPMIDDDIVGDVPNTPLQDLFQSGSPRPPNPESPMGSGPLASPPRSPVEQPPPCVPRTPKPTALEGEETGYDSTSSESSSSSSTSSDESDGAEVPAEVPAEDPAEVPAAAIAAAPAEEERSKCPDFILGQRVMLQAHAGKNDEGLRVMCMDPRHAKCSRYRSTALQVHKWGERAAEAYLGAWLSFQCETREQHKAFQPRDADIQRYLDENP